MSHSTFYTQKLLLRNRKGFDEKRDRFCAGIKCVCSMCEMFGQVDETCERFLLFHMDDSDSLNFSGVELYIHFLINNGLLIDDVKCFDLLNHPRTCMESSLNDEKSSPVC